MVAELSVTSWGDSYSVTNEPPLLSPPFNFRVPAKTFKSAHVADMFE